MTVLTGRSIGSSTKLSRSACVYRKKRALRKEQIAKMLDISAPKTQSWLKKKLWGHASNGQGSTRAGALLQQAELTKYMTTKPRRKLLLPWNVFLLTRTFITHFRTRSKRRLMVLPLGTTASITRCQKPQQKKRCCALVTFGKHAAKLHTVRRNDERNCLSLFTRKEIPKRRLTKSQSAFCHTRAK